MNNKKLRKISSWINDTVNELNHQDELLAYKLIKLKILQYMEDNNISHQDIANQTGVNIIYVNKFFHDL